MATSEELRQRLGSLIKSNEVVLFMKGNRAFPQCGFSARVAQILDSLLPEYATVDAPADDEIRQGIKEYSSWPTIPQLYIKGELIGGSDIVASLYATGELHKKLGLEAGTGTPATPAQVRQMTPRELKEKLQSNVKLELFDVRTPEERAIARIEGSRLLDEEVATYIGTLPLDTLLVFHCHLGMRSQQAAEYFADRGFRNVWNLAGGIDAWSLEVDSSVARYQ